MSEVPQLAATPSLELDADDILRRRVYIGQPLTHSVTEQRAKSGDVFVAAGAEDPDPEVLYTGPYDAEKNPGVLFHVLNMRKGKSLKVGNDFMVYPFNDPDNPAPKEADTTYNFDLVLPEHDEDLPYKFTLSRSGRGTALKIIDVLVRASINGPLYNSAFHMWSIEKSGSVGKWYVAQVKPAKANKKHVEIAASLDTMFGPQTAQPALARSNQPAI